MEGMQNETGMKRKSRSAPQESQNHGYIFFWAYFFYYAAYAVFSGNAVLFLSECGFSAALCGMVTSAMLLCSLIMQPAGGYVTDTLCSTRSYLTAGILLFILLCFCCMAEQKNRAALIAGMILGAGIVYPVGQLMDAWVKMSAVVLPGLRYSRIRAGGSFGFALMSIAAGQWFRRFGWDKYFLIQAAVFMLMLPLVRILPEIPPANRNLGEGKREEKEKKEETEEREETEKTEEARALNTGATKRLTVWESFRMLLHNRKYMFWFLVCTIYWFSHRPIGSFLSLLVMGRGGDAGTYGNVCGAGAIFEFLCLMLIGGGTVLKFTKQRPSALMPAALFTGILRPLCFMLFPGLLPVYAGQVLQSLSFALYYTASVECFALSSDERIRSFSISTGLALSSAAGTAGANLFGGRLCDIKGPEILPLISLSAAVVNLLLIAAAGRRSFSSRGPGMRVSLPDR